MHGFPNFVCLESRHIPLVAVVCSCFKVGKRQFHLHGTYFLKYWDLQAAAAVLAHQPETDTTCDGPEIWHCSELAQRLKRRMSFL